MTVPFETFGDFLSWIFSPSAGGLVIVMWFISWTLEKAEFWANLNSKLKLVITYVASILLGIGAYLLSENEALVTAIEPYFKVVLSVTVAWLATQVAHENNPARVIEYEIIEEEDIEPVG